MFYVGDHVLHMIQQNHLSFFLADAPGSETQRHLQALGLCADTLEFLIIIARDNDVVDLEDVSRDEKQRDDDINVP